MIKVNNHVFSQEEFDFACKNYQMKTKTQELNQQEKLTIANQLIDAHLLLEEAKKTGIVIDQAEIEESFNNVKSQFPSQEQFEQALQQMGDTVDTFREKLDRDLLLREYMNQQFFSKATVSQDDVQGFYNQNKEQFIAPAQVKASHILVKEQELATEIRDKLADGADFGELAMEFSTCPSKKKGGDLGFFSKGKMVPEFEAAAFSMDKGTVSDPVKTQFGYHLIQVTEKAEEHKQGFQEVEEAIKNHMVGVAADKKIGEMLDTLRESAEIVIDEKEL